MFNRFEKFMPKETPEETPEKKELEANEQLLNSLINEVLQENSEDPDVKKFISLEEKKQADKLSPEDRKRNPVNPRNGIIISYLARVERDKKYYREQHLPDERLEKDLKKAILGSIKEWASRLIHL